MLAWTELSVAALLLATATPMSPAAPSSLADLPIPAEEANPPGSITGTVLDATSTRGIVDVSVTLTGTHLSATTDRNGHFEIAKVPEGRYELKFSRLGYRTRRDSITVAMATNLIVSVQLSAQAVPLTPIHVVARPTKLMAVGFYQRRSHGGGLFFTRKQILAAHVRQLSDLLAGVAGLRRQVRPNGSSVIVIRGFKTFFTNCGVQLFLDGVQMDTGPMGVDMIPIRDVAGVEVYRGPSELPPQFDVGSAMCGAVLIWMRDGSGS